MTVHSLTTTATQLIEARDVKRKYQISGAVYDGCDTIYIRFSSAGDADIAIMRRGTSIFTDILPAQCPLYAWTDGGVAKLVTREVYN